MSREYDIFYDAAGEGSWSEFRPFFYLTDGVQEISASPKAYNLNQTLIYSIQQLEEGTVVVFESGDTRIHMEVVERYFSTGAAWPTEIVLRPLCSDGDVLPVSQSSSVGFSLPHFSTLYTDSTASSGSAYAEASRLIMDLTEAPEETYDYVIFGCGWLNATVGLYGNDGTETTVRAMMRICKPDDIYADAGVNADNDIYTQNIVTITKGSTKRADLSTDSSYGYELDGGECYNAQVGGIVSLKGGQRYDVSLQFSGKGNNTTSNVERIQMHQARLIAFRYDASAATTFGTTATSTAGADQIADGHNENKLSSIGATLDYLTNSVEPTSVSAVTISVSLATSSYITADNTNSIRVSPYANGSARTQTDIIPRSATDRLATGAIRYDTFDGTESSNTTKVRFRNLKGSGSTDIYYGFMITFVPLLLSATADSVSSGTDIVGNIGTTGWKDIEGISPSDGSGHPRSAGYTTQTLYTSLRASQSGTSTDVAWVRPRGFYLSDPSDPSTQVQTTAPFGRSGYLGNNNSTSATEKALATAFFERSLNEVAVTGRYIGAQVLNGDGSGGVGTSINDVGLNTPETTALYETPVPAIPFDAATSVIAELLPGIGLKAWFYLSAPATGQKLYKTKIAGMPEIKEVYRGLTRLTLSTAAAPGTDLDAADAWQYDASTGTLYVQLLDAFVPTKASCHIFAVTPIRVSLSTENIKIGGTYYPFESRMEGLPNFSKSLSSSGGKFQNSVSLGKISLAAADGEFDNEFFDYIWQGRDANLWIGNSSVSDDIQDFNLIARATMVVPSWSDKKMDIGLLDKKVDLSKALHQSTMTWMSGNLVAGTTTTSSAVLKKQPIPVVYGNVQRIPAYRFSSEGLDAEDNSAYQFAANNCSLVTKVYATADGSRGSTSLTDAAEIGRVGVNNGQIAALGAPEGATYDYDSDDVPDTIYLDALGQCERDGSNDITKNFYHIGEIGYDLLTRIAPGEATPPIATTDIDKSSFDLMDSKKRHNVVDVDPDDGDDRQGFRSSPEPVQVGLVIESGKTVAEVFNSLCNGTFSYWKTNAAGRIAIEVADFYGGNLIVNGSGELPDVLATGTAIYPWDTIGSGTTIERKRVNVANNGSRVPAFNGRYSIVLTSSNAITSSYAYQDIPIPKSGTYVLTLVASSTNSSFGTVWFDGQINFEIFLPDGTSLTGDNFAIPNPLKSTWYQGDAAWARFSTEFEVEFGNAGIARLALNSYISGFAGNIAALDMIQLFPVACVLTDENTVVGGMSFATENYYGYGVPFAARQAVNALGRKQSRVRTFTDTEAIEGIFATTEFSEAKDLVSSSGVATLSDPVLVDEAGADGVASAGVTYYSRQRVNLSVKVLGLSSVPVVGEYVYMKSVSRIDSGPNENPIWRIMSVSYDAKMPKTISLKLEKPVDPISDRMGTAYLS